MRMLTKAVVTTLIGLCGCGSNSGSPQTEELGTVQSAYTQPVAPWWHLDRIDQASLPLNATYNYLNEGAVDVYVVGKGVATHSEYMFNTSRELLPPGATHGDCDGRGTAVAGVVGAATYGVAKGAIIHSIKYAPCSGGSEALYDMLEILRSRAATTAVPMVAVLTFPIDGWGQGVRDKLDAIAAAGVSVVIPVYENGDLQNDLSSDIMFVGATDENDTLLWGPRNDDVPDLRAPGLWVQTTDRTNVTAYHSGTHISAGIVAGAAAQYLQCHPTATPSAVKAALLGNATVIRPSPWPIYEEKLVKVITACD